tara:strand:- start:549 stop:674 length:126 start_codon:yes stop_codon:yes gene_type:complete
MIVFGVTVAWSIQTTTKKAFQLLAKEREGTDSGSKETDSLI